MRFTIKLLDGHKTLAEIPGRERTHVLSEALVTAEHLMEDITGYRCHITVFSDADEVRPMRLLDAIPREELDSYTGQVKYDGPHGITYYGFLNDSNEFVELFADGPPGRSHRCLGKIHPDVLEKLYVGTLLWDDCV